MTTLVILALLLVAILVSGGVIRYLQRKREIEGALKTAKRLQELRGKGQKP